MKAQMARRVTCPRCAAPVTGDFKFCPECAYRLHAGLEAVEDEASRGSRLGPALLVGGALLVVAGFLAFGLMLFGPDTKRPSTVSAPQRLDHALTVRDLLAQMVELKEGVAYYVGEFPDVPRAVMAAAMGFMPYEVTRGQWAEFVRDLEQHPEKIPHVIRDSVWRNTEYARLYADAWWELAKDRLGIQRPAWLEPPLSDSAGLLLLVPPSWTRATEWEEITWDLPQEDPTLISENFPVTEVSWWDAIAFAEWATTELKVPTQLRLPLPTEWIRAAHGNDWQRLWPWGDEPFPYASNTLNFWPRGSTGRPLPVDFLYADGGSGVTREGIWAMAGNAAEWTYPDPPAEGEDPDRPNAPRYGGSFQMGLDDCQVEAAVWSDKRTRTVDSGFRLVLVR